LLQINQVYNEDCIGEKGMCLIDDKSVDLILCDLPYQITSNKWDIIIPFDKLWEQYERIIKDKGAIVLTANQPFTTALINSNIKLFKYDLIWDKKHPKGFLNAKKRPLRRHEDILIFCNGTPPYYPQMRKGKYRNKKCGGTNNGCYGEFSPKDNYNDEYYPTSIIEISSANQRNKIHSTQKPVELFEYLIKTYSNEGDLILDNCMGSFTTAVASINTNRNYIGFEMDKGYYDLGCKRVENLKGLNG